MQRGSEAKPWLGMAYGKSADFRGPLMFERFAVKAPRGSWSITDDSLTFAAYMRCHQRKRGTGHELDTWQCRRLPLAFNEQQVLETELGADRRKTELLRSTFEVCGRRRVTFRGGWKGNPAIHPGACRCAARSRCQNRFHEAAAIE